MTEKKLRGFAALKQRDPGLLARISATGGKAAHQSGRAHEFTSEEAAEARRTRTEQDRARRASAPPEQS